MAFSLFSTPQTQQQHSLFQTPQQPQPQPQPLFQTPQQQQTQRQTGFLFPQQQQQQQQFFQQQQQQQPQQQQQQLQLYLFTKDKAAANYSTKWADLHQDSQKLLLQIEERILEYRDESQRLDECSRLYDSSGINDGFELDASHIVQELGGISTSLERQKALLQELMSNVKEMLRNTEVAVRSFMMLRPQFLHPQVGSVSSATGPSQTPAATLQSGSSAQTSTASIVPVFDFYNGLPKKPSPFLQKTVFRFEKYLTECHQWIEELEQLFLIDSDRNTSNGASSLLHSLPKVMSNLHDFFVHVAAKVESIHQFVESMKTAYLVDQRRRGDVNDPFLEADRRETARQEAAAKRVHPTLHLPANSQPSTQVAGLFSSSGANAAANSAQTSAAATSSSGSGFSLSTPSAPSASMSSLFTTPSTSAQVPSLFPISSATTQTSNFGTSSASLFGSASASSLFSTGPSFTSNPFATATGLGTSFSASKSSRPKTRTARR